MRIYHTTFGDNLIDYQSEFSNLLKEHVKQGYLRNPKIQEVLESIPLQYILDESQLDRFVLEDSPAIFFYKDQNNVRTLSAPHMISMMLSILELKETDKVLILGAKGGLIEAAIAKIVKSVFIVEEHEEIATVTEEAFIKLGMKNIWVHQGNPFHGLIDNAPYSKILITGAIPFIPQRLINQLNPRGILVFPMMISRPDIQIIFQLINNDAKFNLINFGTVIFSPLYTENIPEINLTEDFTLRDLVIYAKKHPNEFIFKEKPFFEEFRQLPNLSIFQVKFQQNNEIFYSYSSKNDNLEHINLKISIYIKNPGKAISTKLQIFNEFAAHKEIYPKISLYHGSDNLISFNINIPNKEGKYKYDLTVLSDDGYRLTNTKIIIYNVKNRDEMNLSIEMI